MHGHRQRNLRNHFVHRERDLRRDGSGHTDHQRRRPTHYLSYDAAGQLTSVTQRADPANATTAVTVTLGYDRRGNQVRTVDGKGNLTENTYNTWGLLETTIEPATTVHPNTADRTWTLAYDAAGQATTAILPGGITRTKTYDGLGRVTDEAGTGATTTARHVDYDALGRTTQVNAPGGNATFTWNDRDLLTASTAPAGNATFTYDGDNRLTERDDTAGHTTFGYDDAGRITTLTDPLTGTTASYDYNNAGQLDSMTLGAGNGTRDLTYDNRGRLTTDAWSQSGGTTAVSAIYGYDDDNLLTSKQPTASPALDPTPTPTTASAASPRGSTRPGSPLPMATTRRPTGPRSPTTSASAPPPTTNETGH
ncbi:hypothetical protein ACFQX7_27020 [Luedemannella flava]